MRAHMRSRLGSLALLLPLLVLAGCATFGESLGRGAMHYDAERWNEALAVWTELEADVPDQSRPQQGEYYTYLALTHLQLGHRSDARHYLAIARQFWGVLPEALHRRIQDAEGALGRPN